MKGNNPGPVNRTGAQDQLQPSNNLEPDISSYFLARRRTNRSLGNHDIESRPVSPLFGLNRGRTKQKSGSSNKSNLDTTVTTSAGSFSSQASKYPPNVSDWNETVLWDSKNGFVEPPPCHAADPPRPPREGFEWVWFPEGYWAEREKREFTPKKQKNNRHKCFNRTPGSQASYASTNKTATSDRPPNFEPPRIKIGSKSLEPSSNGSQSAEDRVIHTVSGKSSNKLRRGLQLMNPAYPHFTAPDGTPEGLYGKTRRSLEARLKQRPKIVRHRDCSF
jgi:parafibromin